MWKAQERKDRKNERGRQTERDTADRQPASPLPLAACALSPARRISETARTRCRLQATTRRRSEHCDSEAHAARRAHTQTLSLCTSCPQGGSAARPSAARSSCSFNFSFGSHFSLVPLLFVNNVTDAYCLFLCASLCLWPACGPVQLQNSRGQVRRYSASASRAGLAAVSFRYTFFRSSNHRTIHRNTTHALTPTL